MTTPDPRLAALRALAEKATPGPRQVAIPARGQLYELRTVTAGMGELIARHIERSSDAAFLAALDRETVLALLDALAAAERARGIWHGTWVERSSDRDRIRTERDALAARLVGALRVVEAAREALDCDAVADWNNVNGDGLEAVMDAYDASEAGGEGRGT